MDGRVDDSVVVGHVVLGVDDDKPAGWVMDWIQSM